MLGADLDILGASGAVGAFEGRDHVADLKVLRQQGVRIELHLILFFKAAEREHFSDAFDRLERIFDHPVGDLAQFDQRARARLIDEAEIHDDAKASGDWAHFRRAETCRDRVGGFAETLADHLTGEINIRAVLEIDIDHGEPEIGGRAHLPDLWQAGHGGLDGEGDITLDLLRREALGFGENLNERGGRIGEGIDRKAAEGKQATERHGDDGNRRQQASACNSVHEIEHDDRILSVRGRRRTRLFQAALSA